MLLLFVVGLISMPLTLGIDALTVERVSWIMCFLKTTVLLFQQCRRIHPLARRLCTLVD